MSSFDLALISGLGAGVLFGASIGVIVFIVVLLLS